MELLVHVVTLFNLLRNCCTVWNYCILKYSGSIFISGINGRLAKRKASWQGSQMEKQDLMKQWFKIDDCNIQLQAAWTQGKEAEA